MTDEVPRRGDGRLTERREEPLPKDLRPSSSTQTTSYLRTDAAGNIEAMFSYLFDPLRRRIAKIDELADDGEWFAYRDEDVAADFERTGGGPIVLTATYIQDLGIDAKVIKFDVDGEQHNLLLDALSSVGAETDGAGGSIQTQLMGAWGEPLASVGTPDPRVSGLAQREHDPESGLQFNRNRVFDPGIGRFGQRDRMFIAGEDDGYSYSANRPLGLTDPTGDYWTFGTEDESYNRWLLRVFRAFLGHDLVVRPRGDWARGRIRSLGRIANAHVEVTAGELLRLGANPWAREDEIQLFLRISEAATEQTLHWWMGRLLGSERERILFVAQNFVPMPVVANRSGRSGIAIALYTAAQGLSGGIYQAPPEVQAEPGFMASVWFWRGAGGAGATLGGIYGAAALGVELPAWVIAGGGGAAPAVPAVAEGARRLIERFGPEAARIYEQWKAIADRLSRELGALRETWERYAPQDVRRLGDLWIEFQRALLEWKSRN